ncbi:MAG TPA: hypothetical protein VIM70_11525 [Clostridium sp.]|uniref:hypothetical protein n=1 Tax=Clostridium sp. TaxID=1506 RepID=UPI002F95C376
MQDILSIMHSRYKLLSFFKISLNSRGYSRGLYAIEIQINLLKELIELESKNVLSQLLKKTYFRLFRDINRGIEYLPDIVSDSENWVLNTIDKDIDAWTSKDVLVCTTKTCTIVFSKISRNDSGYHYIDSKWQ